MNLTWLDLTTDFILVPRYNPIRCIQWPKCRCLWPLVKVKGQGQIFPKMHTKKKLKTGHISEAISPTNFILGTKAQPNKAHLMTLVPMTLTLGQGQRSRSFFSQNGLNTKQLATSLMIFHPQTSSYLSSQLFVTHLGVALLLWLIWVFPSCFLIELCVPLSFICTAGYEYVARGFETVTKTYAIV